MWFWARPGLSLFSRKGILSLSPSLILSKLQGPRPKDDAQLAAAVAAVDASVQRAVAMAAGGGPTAIPEGPLGAVNRNDWLERMRAQDEMLKAAVAKHDTSLHST